MDLVDSFLIPDVTNIVSTYLTLEETLNITSEDKWTDVINRSNDSLELLWIHCNIDRMRLDTFELIIEKFNIDFGSTILNIAVEKNRKDIVRWLIDRNCEGDDYTSQNAILYSQDVEMIDMIWNAGLLFFDYNIFMYIHFLNNKNINEWVDRVLPDRLIDDRVYVHDITY